MSSSSTAEHSQLQSEFMSVHFEQVSTFFSRSRKLKKKQLKCYILSYRHRRSDGQHEHIAAAARFDGGNELSSHTCTIIIDFIGQPPSSAHISVFLSLFFRSKIAKLQTISARLTNTCRWNEMRRISANVKVASSRTTIARKIRCAEN